MSTKFIEQEVSKIMENKELEFPLNMAMTSAWIIGNFKGVNLKILDMKKESSLSDYYILASSTNPTQSKSMAETIMRQMRNYDYTPISTEGFKNSEWILLDFGDVMVHIFLEHTRAVYDLDTLWQAAPSLEIPQEYYFSSENDAEPKKEEGYF